MQWRVEDGYTLFSVQPVVYDGSLHVLATMELVEDNADNE